MPRLQQGETSLQIVLPVEAKQALEKMSEIEQIPSVSELIRQLLENYCRHNGLEVSFAVGTWGGKRTRPSMKSQDADDSLTPVEVTRSEGMIRVKLADGRIIAHPLVWYPWLAAATDEQFANRWMTAIAIYWPDLEDGLSVETLLKGPVKRAAEPATS